jgi:hypothetical protein
VDDVDRLLGRVKARAHGWMPVPVYRRLYDSAAAAGGGTIVEIGTYRGAATRTPWLAPAYRRIRPARRR